MAVFAAHIMEVHVYEMNGEVPAPAGSLNTRDWFYHYKWGEDEEETYVPAPPEAGGEIGDELWFVLDGTVLGWARITDVREDHLNDRVELCYAKRNHLQAPPRLKEEFPPREGAVYLRTIPPTHILGAKLHAIQQNHRETTSADPV